MPRLPPVTSTTPSTLMLSAFRGRIEQSTRNQFFVRRDHVRRHRSDGVLGIGIASAKIAACAHEHMNNGLELFVTEAVDRAGGPCAPENANVCCRDVVQML